ncbi:hypothetical protein HRbin23_01478 [bacterium HR23]|uniref:DNA-binding domain protein HTH_XRE n=1 Tax=uncultured prokaryote TaxID=198431 RepID=H5SLD1_9ZZZZ|nr:DNA-binding domain protein HTH_XRE [uncultured prokaryote]GBD11799.1 hypothetical protein HRbin23_01478 [bacterium HR23]
MRVRLKERAVWTALERLHISQNELARRLGISSGYLSQLICGRRSPSARLRRRFLEVLGPLGFDDLFFLEEQ